MPQPIHTLVTHAGAFHSDEIVALMLLERFYLHRPLRVVDLPEEALLALVKEGARPELEPVLDAQGYTDARTACLVVRTRFPEALDLAKRNPDVFVIDVGGELDPDALNFDHHQGDMQEAWEDGTPFSSTGLIWRWLRSNGLLHELNDAVLQELEEDFIRPLDAHDNGQAVLDVAQTCEGYDRPDDAQRFIQFEKARHFLADVFDNRLYKASLKAEARAVLTQAWNEAQARGDRHVVLAEPLAYQDSTGLLKEISQDQAQLLAIPGKGKRYSLISLPIDDRFSIKCPMPEAWRGTFDVVMEIEGKTISRPFAHKTGFMCIIEGQPQDAHLVARHIVEHNQALTPRRPALGR